MANTNKKIRDLEKKYVIQSYGRYPVVFDHGKGIYAFDNKGKGYLDFCGGIATCSVGHANPAVIKAINKQAEKLINVTNLYYTEPQIELAKKLVKLSGLDKCFFSNSGTEAVECALKLVRRYTGKPEIIATIHGFHGRTFGALSATWKKAFKKPFWPLVPGFKHVPYNDIKAIENTINRKTAAVIVEPIQGEAGIVMPDDSYLKELRKLCNKKKVLLIIDEIQTGTGRTGKFFAYQYSGIKPDIVCVAKGIANGVPIGVTIAVNKVAKAFKKGDHGSTFGGNCLSCAAANAVIDVIQKKKLMKNASIVGKYFVNKLGEIKNKKIKKIRGKGLIIAVELNVKSKPVVDKCLEKGLLCINTGNNVIRFLPSLIATKKDVNKAVKILESCL